MYSFVDRRSFDTKSDSYLTHLAINCNKSQLAVNLSNEWIEIIDSKTLQTTIEVKDFDGLKPSIKYSPQNPNHLIVCTSDALKIFDLRHKSHKCSKEFKVSENDLNLNELNCFDFNCDFNYFCVGTEVSDNDKNCYLLFWDIRRPALALGTYSESHSNDITDIAFHPFKRNVFATASCDQLVNVFDMNQTEEEEAIMSTLNVESTVDRIRWTQSNENSLICLTRDESIHLWDFEEVVPELSVSALSSDSGFDYAIDVLSKSDWICVANESHFIKMFDIKTTKTSHDIHFEECLSGGHNRTVRHIVTDPDTGVIYSGAEDSVLCVWNRIHKQTDPQILKSQTKTNRTKRSKPY